MDNVRERQGLIVWYKHRRNINQLRRFGHVIYTSRKMRYAILYVDRSKIDKTSEQLKGLPFVKRVEQSLKPFLNTNYENALPDQAKLYDYKS